MSDDFPKYWTEEEFDPETGEIIENTSNTQALMPVEEEICLPTINEQKTILSTAEDISQESKGMLGSLIEMNSIANVLSTIGHSETAEQRKNVIQAWAEGFINSRFKNNILAEKLKGELLQRLLVNIDNLDLDTTARIYNDLSDVSSVDAQQALAMITGSGGSLSQGNGINLTINNATSEGASITTNTLNATPQQVGQLKETSQLNASIKAWSNIPLPKKKTINTEYELIPNKSEK